MVQRKLVFIQLCENILVLIFPRLLGLLEAISKTTRHLLAVRFLIWLKMQHLWAINSYKQVEAQLGQAELKLGYGFT